MIFRKSTASNPTTSRTLGTNWVFSYVDNLLYIYRKELMKDTKLSIKLSRNLFVWIFNWDHISISWADGWKSFR